MAPTEPRSHVLLGGWPAVSDRAVVITTAGQLPFDFDGALGAEAEPPDEPDDDELEPEDPLLLDEPDELEFLELE